MKKKLEAELISIAHRILQLKNKSDLVQLHQETQKLYEKLSVLRFVEDHFDGARPTIGRTEVTQKLETLFDAPNEAAIEETTEKPKKTNTVKEPENAEVESEIKSPEADEPVENEEETPLQSTETNNVEPVLELESDVEAVSDIEIELSAPEIEELESTTTEKSVEESTELGAAEEVNVSKPEPETSEIENNNIIETKSVAEAGTGKQENIYDAEVKAIEAIAKSNDSFFKPSFELAFDAKEENETPKLEEVPSKPIVFEDFLGTNYVDPVFVKPEELNTNDQSHKETAIPISRNVNDNAQVISLKKDNDNNTQTLNDRISKGITIGLNDRIAFMKHLFNNSSEDYNRVLSQLITFDTLSEATTFIDTMVKPDYNNWEGKDEYSQRFMEIIEKKFA